MTLNKGDHWFRAQGPGFAVALLLLVIAGGTAGYMLAVQREDRRMEFNPEPDASIRSGDTLVVLGRPESLRLLEAEAAEGGD